jgi:hypothetical protein
MTFIQFQIGNGEKNFLWNPDGVLVDKYEYRAIYDARNQIHDKLSTVIVIKTGVGPACKIRLPFSNG